MQLEPLVLMVANSWHIIDLYDSSLYKTNVRKISPIWNNLKGRSWGSAWVKIEAPY